MPDRAEQSTERRWTGTPGPSGPRWSRAGLLAVPALIVALVAPLTLPSAEAGPVNPVAARCQRTIVRMGAAVARKQLLGLGGCLDRMIQCLETRPGDQACLEGRRAECGRTFRRLAAAEGAVALAIVKACGPAGPDLLDLSGLGYSLVGDRCRAEFDAPLSDASTIAQCLIRQHHCGALGILAAQERRTEQVLTAAGVDSASLACLRGPPAISALVRSAIAPSSPRCEQSARRAGRDFALIRLGRLGECAHAIFACGGGEPDNAACAAGARQKCDHAVVALTSAVVRLGRTVDRACPDLAESVAASSQPCALLGGGTDHLPSDAATCRLQRDGCQINELLHFESPRSTTLLGEIGVDANGIMCAASALLPIPTATAAGGTISPGAAATRTPIRTPTPTPSPKRAATSTRTRTFTPILRSSPTPTITSTPPVVQALAIDPTTGRTLWAGTNGSGIFASFSSGDSWTPSSAGLTTRTVTAITVDPKTPALVYVGTAGGGVFASASGGASWTASNAGLTNLGIRALAIDPKTPTIVFAATGGHGVFRSASGGASWTALSGGLGNLDVSALVVDPVETTNVYAGTAGSGVFKSTTGGASWSPTSLAESFAGAGVIRSLAIDPLIPSVIYAGTNERGIFKSIDGAVSWTMTGLFSSFPSAASVRALAIDPVTPTTLYAGTNRGGVFASQDGGTTWTPTSLAGSFPHATSVRTLVIDPQAPRTLYAGTQGGGVFKSTDGGETWSPARSGLPIS